MSNKLCVTHTATKNILKISCKKCDISEKRKPAFSRLLQSCLDAQRFPFRPSYIDIDIQSNIIANQFNNTFTTKNEITAGNRLHLSTIHALDHLTESRMILSCCLYFLLLSNIRASREASSI